MSGRGNSVPAPPVFLFDGHCLLCSRGVQYVLKHDRTETVRFVAIQSGEGQDLARAHGIDPDNPKSFVWVQHGAARTASTAALDLLAFTGGPLRGLGAFRIVPRPVRDFLYARIANNRYRLFGRSDHCLLPSPETRKRFVLPEDMSAG